MISARFYISLQNARPLGADNSRAKCGPALPGRWRVTA